MKTRIVLFTSFILMGVALFANQAKNSGHRFFSNQSSNKAEQLNSRLSEKAGTRYAYISPEHSYFETNNPEDLNFIINWDNETSVTSISCYYGGDFPTKNYVVLVENTDYLIEGDTLTIYESFVSSLDLALFDYMDFEVLFGISSSAYFYVTVVPSVNPYLYPNAVDFDLSNPGDVHTNAVSIANPAEIQTVSVNNSTLTPDVDYVVTGSWLFINEDYLSANLTAAGQQLTLTVSFIGGYESELVITATETGITNATIDPGSATYENEGPETVDITITWNDATAVESLTVFVNSSWEVIEFEWPFYTVTDNGNGTATLTILFGGDEELTHNISSTQNPKGKNDKASETDYITIDVNFDTGAPATFYITYIYNYYDVVVEISPSEAGWVSGDWEYDPGETVWLQAFSNPGYIFKEWQNTEGQTVSTANPYIFTMPADDISLVAIFEEGELQLFTVTYEPLNNNGSLDAYDENFMYITSGSQVWQGSNVQFYAYAGFGYTPTNWTVNGESIEPENFDTYLHSNIQEDIHVTVDFVEFSQPYIEPNQQYFSISDPQDVEFEILWGSETSISNIFFFDFDNDGNYEMISLQEGIDYIITENTLAITASFLLSLDPEVMSLYSFSLEFGSGWTAWFGIVAVLSTEPLLIPDTLSYDLSNPGDLQTTLVVLGGINTVASITGGETPLNSPADYEMQGPWIILKESFLASQLTAADQQLVLTVILTEEQELPLTITAVESDVVNATINPSSITYEGEMPLYQDITITWNDASAVTGLQVTVVYEEGAETFDWPFYQVTNNNNGTANLRIFFDEDDRTVFGKTSKVQEYISYADIKIGFDVGAPSHFLLTMIFRLYEVNVTITPGFAGWVSGDWSYEPGEEVYLEAHPTDGFLFLNWQTPEGDIVSTSNPYTFTMPKEDVFLVALFIDASTPTYTLTLVANPADGGIVSGGGSFYEGHTVTAKANPHAGFNFINWTNAQGDIISTEATFSHSMPAANTVHTANFEAIVVYHSAIFNVKYDDQPLQNASVLINENEVLTNNQGVALFSEVADGTHNYTISHEDYLDATGSFTMAGEDVTININMIPTNIKLPDTQIISVFPNPFSENLFVSSSTEINRVTIANITGQIVLDQEINSDSQSLSTKSLPNGLYMITLWMESGNQVIRKIVKQ